MISPETTSSVPAFRFVKTYQTQLSTAILIIFHAVGFWGLTLSGNPVYFQNLTPFNLLLTNLLLFSFHRGFHFKFLLFATGTFLAGFLAEVLGVHTGLLFGHYTYGNALGFKLWEVPVLIGLNWVMLIYSAGTLFNKTHFSPILKALLATLLLVGLDWFIEAAAVRFDFWSWKNNLIPLSNFAGWFVVAFALQLFFQFTLSRNTNKIAAVVIYTQFVFFVSLYLYYL